MSRRVERSVIVKLLKIGETPEASIIKKIAVEEFGEDFKKLDAGNILVHFKNLKEIEVVDGENEYVAEIQRKDGKNMYFSPADGWVAVTDDEISIYRINFEWFLRQIMNSLDISDRHEPKGIQEDCVWALGQHRLEKQLVHLVIVRNIKQSVVFNSLIDYLNKYHTARNPALVISLDRHMPEHLQLPSQNEFMKIDDAIVWDKDKFELSTVLLAGKMGGTISKLGFSNSYRTFNSNGNTYEFTKMQSEALEFMDGESKAVHQTEILSQTSSQEGNKLRVLFKGKGGIVHDAWGTIIKSDRKGNYWLEY